MIRNAVPILTLFVVLLLVVACDSEPPTSPYTGYLTEEIPPCTSVEGSAVDPCDPKARLIIEGRPDPTPTPDPANPTRQDTDTLEASGVMREALDGPFPGSAPHLVLRGTYLPKTVRCNVGRRLRPPTYLIPELYEGPIEEGYLFFNCYADVRVGAYILGQGPPTLPVLIIWWVAFPDSFFAEDAARTGKTVQELIDEQIQWMESEMDAILPGREEIMFLGPPYNMSVEVWQYMGAWDVQRREDGVVVAAYPYRDDLKLELPAFKQVLKTANQARFTEYGGRVGADPGLPMLVTDANRLREFYIDIGAYDYPDGPPAQPPPS